MSTVNVGAQVAGVRVEKLVARTGSSEVYRGTDLTTGVATALKVLPNADKSAERRLHREAMLLREVDHRAIVPFHSLQRHDGDLILVTNWVDGSSLRDRVAERNHL